MDNGSVDPITVTQCFSERPGGETKRLDRANGGAVAFSPREDSLSIWGWGTGTPALWDIASGRPRAVTGTRHRDMIVSQAFSRDGSILATGVAKARSSSGIPSRSIP